MYTSKFNQLHQSYLKEEVFGLQFVPEHGVDEIDAVVENISKR